MSATLGSAEGGRAAGRAEAWVAGASSVESPLPGTRTSLAAPQRAMAWLAEAQAVESPLRHQNDS